jgi:hypothetical protein
VHGWHEAFCCADIILVVVFKCLVQILYRLGATGREIMHNEMFIWDQCEVYERQICPLAMPESARFVPD